MTAQSTSRLPPPRHTPDVPNDLAGVGFPGDPIFVTAGQDGVAVPRGITNLQSSTDKPTLKFKSDRAFDTLGEVARRAETASHLRKTLSAQIQEKKDREYEERVNLWSRQGGGSARPIPEGLNFDKLPSPCDKFLSPRGKFHSPRDKFHSPRDEDNCSQNASVGNDQFSSPQRRRYSYLHSTSYMNSDAETLLAGPAGGGSLLTREPSGSRVRDGTRDQTTARMKSKVDAADAAVANIAEVSRRAAAANNLRQSLKSEMESSRAAKKWGSMMSSGKPPIPSTTPSPSLQRGSPSPDPVFTPSPMAGLLPSPEALASSVETLQPQRERRLSITAGTTEESESAPPLLNFKSDAAYSTLGEMERKAAVQSELREALDKQVAEKAARRESERASGAVASAEWVALNREDSGHMNHMDSRGSLRPASSFLSHEDSSQCVGNFNRRSRTPPAGNAASRSRLSSLSPSPAPNDVMPSHGSIRPDNSVSALSHKNQHDQPMLNFKSDNMFSTLEEEAKRVASARALAADLEKQIAEKMARREAEREADREADQASSRPEEEGPVESLFHPVDSAALTSLASSRHLSGRVSPPRGSPSRRCTSHQQPMQRGQGVSGRTEEQRQAAIAHVNAKVHSLHAELGRQDVAGEACADEQSNALSAQEKVEEAWRKAHADAEAARRARLRRHAAPTADTAAATFPGTLTSGPAKNGRITQFREQRFSSRGDGTAKPASAPRSLQDSAHGCGGGSIGATPTADTAPSRTTDSSSSPASDVNPFPPKTKDMMVGDDDKVKLKGRWCLCF